jgi:hypothetical protein
MDLAENLHSYVFWGAEQCLNDPPLLDPVLGQNVELGLCVEIIEVREMRLLVLSSFLLSLSIARGLSM